MRRLLNVRIRRWYFKLLFAAGVWLIGYPVVLAGASTVVATAVNLALTLAGILLGARLFRGKDEPDQPARPWWQMTARRPLSLVLGIVALLTVAAYVINYIAAAAGSLAAIRSLERVPLAEAIIGSVFAAACAFLYLNSAARLPRPVKRVREPRFKASVTLD